MKQLEADIVVVAAGTAGLAAAIAAAEKGVRVVALEKGATTGGTGNMAMGLFAVESRLQRLKQVALTREEAFNIFMNYTHWRVDARLVKAYIDKSADTIDWLEKMGVEFFEPAAYFPGANFTWHIVRPSSGRQEPECAATMMRIMTQRAKELGVQILLQTPAKKILREGGRIVGVAAEDKSVQAIQVKAKAVIIATGGCGDNPDMIKKYTGYEWGKDLFSFRVPGLAGDGIRMAWEVGAGKTDISMEIIYGLPEGDPLGALNIAFRQPNLLVNLLGQRFINEGIIGNTTFTGNAISIQKNRCAFNIFDEATKKYYEDKGFDLFSVVFPFTRIIDFDAALKQALDQGYEHIFVADSLEELAGKTGINPDGLRKTVEEYNKACQTGRDEIFHKNPRYLRPVKQPRFYAGRLFPRAYGTLGGIKINYKMEVVTQDFEVIPGLYAAGTDACAIYGDSYVFVLPGNTMGFAVSSGRIAGENAAEYAKTVAK